MTDEEAIRRLLAQYSQFCDDGEFDQFAMLFTTDAELQVMGDVHVGREAIKTFMTAAQPPSRRGRHVITNAVIDVDSDSDSAEVRTDYLFVSPQKVGGFASTNVGRDHDRLVKRGGAWRFAVREIVFFSTPDM